MTGTPPSPTSNPTDTPPWGVVKAARDLTGVVLGDYQVEHLLGRGGMGEVYLARQVSLNRAVALKVLRPDLLENPSSMTRFEAEALAAAKLNHPNIVHIYNFGHVGPTHYIAMEYVRGTNLRDYLSRKLQLDLPLALSIMKQAGLAVEAAGEVGLIHRDLKPENLLLTRKGLVKVADFGLCRDLDGKRVELTQPGMTLGTPLYMSPEQVRGHKLDRRSDLYSLGVTFYHMLAGVPPFHAETPLALAMKHVHEAPLSLADHRPDLPREVVDLVMRLLAKSPAERPASATEMLRDLAAAREASRGVLSGIAHPAAFTVGGDPSRGLPTAISVGSGPVPAGAQPLSVAVAVALATAPARWGSRAVLPALMVLGLTVGVVAAWLTRGEDLLSDAATPPTGPPGLWLAPSWATKVHPREDAAAQYRLAQLQLSEAGREAAWLAVPGRFPDDRHWGYRAYIQLGRHLLRAGDREALAALAAELARTPLENDKDLSRVLRAGVSALDGHPDAVQEALEHAEAALQARPPDLTELALEVIARARRPAPGRQAPTDDLLALRRTLERALGYDPRDAPPRAKSR